MSTLRIKWETYITRDRHTLLVHCVENSLNFKMSYDIWKLTKCSSTYNHLFTVLSFLRKLITIPMGGKGLRESMKLNCKFLEGGRDGGFNRENLPWWRYGYFLEPHHIHVHMALNRFYWLFIISLVYNDKLFRTKSVSFWPKQISFGFTEVNIKKINNVILLCENLIKTVTWTVNSEQ